MRRTTNITHGAKVNGKVKPTYRSWQMMKNRCNNKRGQDYQYYGGRGITYDPTWETYEGFVADMGEAPEGLTIERVDNDGNYTKDNCVWATRQTQARNRAYCETHTYEGETLHTWEWAEKLGIKAMTFHWRLWLHRKDPENYPLSVVFMPRGKVRKTTPKKPYTPSAAVLAKREQAVALRAAGHTQAQIAAAIGCSLVMVRRYLLWDGVGFVSEFRRGKCL